jgi:hypothetical protein
MPSDFRDRVADDWDRAADHREIDAEIVTGEQA